MFTVTGSIDGVPYRVGVHDEPVDDERYGNVMGSDHATALLFAHVGDEAKGSPTSDPLVLDLSDPASVLAYLREFTTVTDVEGQTPEEAPAVGAIY